MAVTFVAYNTAQKSYNGADTLIITAPAGVQNGDLLIAHFQSHRTDDTHSTLAGWTPKDSENTVGRSSLFYKVALSEGASYTLSINSTGATSIIGAISAWRGVDTTTLFSAESKNADATADTTADGTAITPTKAPGGLVMAFTSLFLATDSSVSAHAIANHNPTWAEAYDVSQSTGNVICCAYGSYDFVTTTGAYTATIADSAESTTYLVHIAPVLSVSAGFTFAGVLGNTLSAVLSFASGFTFAGAIAGTPAIGSAKWSDPSKNSSSWSDTPKS